MKVKIKLVFLGHLPHSIDRNKIESWKSSLFEIVKPIDTYTIITDSDLPTWGYSDKNITGLLPNRVDTDILLAITYVPIEQNYFARRFSDNRVCVTFYEMTDILSFSNIPLENLILRVLYSISLVYKRYGNRIPEMQETTNFAHDETRGCIFDMNGIKTDIIYSVNKPQLCNSCIQSLTTARVNKNLIDTIQCELRKIKKNPYYRIVDFIKKYPIAAICISSISAIILGAIGSIIATLLWEKVLK